MPTPTLVEEGRLQQGEEGAGLHRMEVEEGGALLEEEEEVEGGALAEEEVEAVEEEGDPAPGSPPSARASAGAGPAPTAGAPDSRTWTASTRCNPWPTLPCLPLTFYIRPPAASTAAPICAPALVSFNSVHPKV